VSLRTDWLRNSLPVAVARKTVISEDGKWMELDGRDAASGTRTTEERRGRLGDAMGGCPSDPGHEQTLESLGQRVFGRRGRKKV
jgi:hypothetical protein